MTDELIRLKQAVEATNGVTDAIAEFQGRSLASDVTADEMIRLRDSIALACGAFLAACSDDVLRTFDRIDPLAEWGQAAWSPTWTGGDPLPIEIDLPRIWGPNGDRSGGRR